MRLIFPILAACGLAVGGCATKTFTVRVISDPSGATVWQDGNRFGKAPFNLVYYPNSQDRKNGYVKTAPITVTWPSGTSKTCSWSGPETLDRF